MQTNYIILPIIVGEYKAKLVAENLLKQLWNDGEVYILKLPPTYLSVAVSDVILFKEKELKVIEVEVGWDYSVIVKCVKNIRYNTLLENDKIEVKDNGENVEVKKDKMEFAVI
jgi:hypothetical protein